MQEGPPGREPHPVRSKRPRALDHALESDRLDFAERRRRADDDRRAEDMRPEDVAERRAALRSQARLRLVARLGEHKPRPSALDQRAHPPRRLLAGAGKSEESATQPRRGVACLGGRAFRGQRVLARKKNREPPVARRLEANVRVDVAERQAPQRVEDEAELRGQPAQALVLLEPPLERGHARPEIE